MALKYIITGTGRCGTGYMANVFETAGIRCGHESIFKYNSCAASVEMVGLNLELEADSSWLAAPCLGMPEFAGATVIHLVRHPKRVIDSYVRIGFFIDPSVSGYAKYMHNALPLLHSYQKPYEKAGALYLAWNSMIEPWARIFHRVEDKPYPIFTQLGVRCDPTKLYKHNTFNHRGGPDTNIQLTDFPDHLYWPLYRMTRKYGYGDGWPCE